MKLKLIYLFFITVSFFLYFPARYAGFTHDMVSWAMQYDKYYFWEGLKVMFGDKSLHPIYHSVNFWLYKIFGINSLSWFFIQITLHSTIAFWAYLFFSRLFEKNNFAFWGAFLFLISPYQTEVVIWKATLHYLICSVSILASLNFYLNYYEKNDKKSLFYIQIAFIIALLSLELGLTIPFFISLLIFYLPDKKLSKFQQLIKIIFPQLIAIALFFIATKQFTGGWTGHYGSEKHLDFSLITIIPNLLKHFYKVLLFGQYIQDFNKNDLLFSHFSKNWVIQTVLGVILSATSLFIYKSFKKQKATLPFFLGLCFTALLPVINLFVYTLTPVLSDRFTYLFSLFALMTLVYFFNSFSKYLTYCVSIIFIYCSLHFLNLNINSWALNDQWMRSLMLDYKWFEEKEVYVLNCFDSINGTVGLRSEYEGFSSVAEALSVYRKDMIVKGKIKEIYMYNPRNESDTIRRYSNKNDQFGLVIPDGTWFIRTAKGAKNFKTDEYEAKIDEWNVGVTLEFFKSDSNRIVIFQQKDKWIKF